MGTFHKKHTKTVNMDQRKTMCKKKNFGRDDIFIHFLTVQHIIPLNSHCPAICLESKHKEYLQRLKEVAWLGQMDTKEKW